MNEFSVGKRHDITSLRQLIYFLILLNKMLSMLEMIKLNKLDVERLIEYV